MYTITESTRSVSSSGAQGRRRSQTPILCETGHGHRQAHSPEDLHSSVGVPPGQVPAYCFPGGAPQEKQPSPRRVSFADEVTMLGEPSPSVSSPDLGSPTQILPAVAEEDVMAPVGEPIGYVSSAPAAGLPPPPGFSPFSWPVDDGDVDVDMLCFPFNVDSSPSLSPIDPVCSDVSDSVGSREVGLLVSPLVDSCSDLPADVGHPVLQFPSVESLFVQDMLWTPVAPQPPVLDNCHAISVPRWRLAREGPFLAERSPKSVPLWLDVPPEYYIPRLGLRGTIGGLRTSYASPAVHRMDWGPPIGRSPRN